MDKFRGIVDSI